MHHSTAHEASGERGDPMKIERCSRQVPNLLAVARRDDRIEDVVDRVFRLAYGSRS